MLFGYALTLLIAGGFIWLAFSKVCIPAGEHAQFCQTRWQLLMKAPFNEVGDSLAGFAGALAFVWLIVTVLIQGRELAAQREELEATREELAMGRKVQEKQLEAMEAQAEVFRDEQSQRAEDRAQRELDARVRNLVVYAKEAKEYDTLFSRAFGLNEHYDLSGGTTRTSTYYDAMKSPDEFLYMMYDRICYSLDHQKELFDDLGGHKNLEFDALFSMQSYLDDILELKGRLSAAENVRLDSLRVETLRQLIHELVNAVVQVGLVELPPEEDPQ